MESIQLLNTAIIKSKEKKINFSYEKRLKAISGSAVLTSINKAIEHLAQLQKISKDQAAIQIVETIRELDSVWTDYVQMEGIERLKDLVKQVH